MLTDGCYGELPTALPPSGEHFRKSHSPLLQVHRRPDPAMMVFEDGRMAFLPLKPDDILRRPDAAYRKERQSILYASKLLVLPSGGISPAVQ